MAKRLRENASTGGPWRGPRHPSSWPGAGACHRARPCAWGRASSPHTCVAPRQSSEPV